MNTCVVLVYGLAHSCLGTWLVVGSPVAESLGQQCVLVLGDISSQETMRSQDRFGRDLVVVPANWVPRSFLALCGQRGLPVRLGGLMVKARYTRDRLTHKFLVDPLATHCPGTKLSISDPKFGEDRASRALC